MLETLRRPRGRLFAGAFALALLGTAATVVPAVAQRNRPAPMERMTEAGMRQMLASWPEHARMAAMDQMQKYGMPQGVTSDTLIWRNNGPWLYTMIDTMETPHSFPMQHPDLMEQAIYYRVPPEMFDDLAAYDGSVTVYRTEGIMSARCDKEGANFLALNLAHDIITRRRDVADARRYYANAIATFMRTGRMDPYMQRLTFQTQGPGAADPDRMAPMPGRRR